MRSDDAVSLIMLNIEKDFCKNFGSMDGKVCIATVMFTIISTSKEIP